MSDEAQHEGRQEGRHPHGGHDHGDHPGREALQGRGLTITLVLVAGYMVAEGVGGWLTNSLALLADAGHMLSDVAALGLSLFAIRLARQPATRRRSYGYYRAEILAALANGTVLVALSIFIFVEAINRFVQPSQVMGSAMLWIAVGGLVINIVGLWLLHGGREQSLNIHGAWLHVLGDALGSIGTIVAAIFIWTLGWYWTDPVASILIGMLIIWSSWSLLKEAVSVLMESAPRGIDPDTVHAAVLQLEGVRAAHDLHIWSITSGIYSLSIHVTVAERADYDMVLADIRAMLHKRFGIDHITVQCEPEGFQERQRQF